MALKQVVLSHKLGEARAKLTTLETTAEELRGRRAAMDQRSAELEAAVNELNAETAQEDHDAVMAQVEQFETDAAALTGEEKDNQTARDELQAEIDRLTAELDELNQRADKPNKEPEHRDERMNTMNVRVFEGMTAEQRSALFAREDVKTYLGVIRSAISEKRAISNAGLLIPDVMLDLIRKEIAAASKLLPFVNLRNVGGKARQNIAGAIPTAIWTEMCANINELTLSFNQVEVDGYKVGGYIAVCNAVLEDSDIDLAGEIVTAIGGAIGKALDDAILFGTGTKMPIGIVTRLAQTSQPAGWGSNAPAWTDLHTSNVKKINVNSSSGAAFFVALVEKLAIAKPIYSGEGLFWAMNRKTHLDILAKALAFDSSAALVSNTNLMPVLGGTIVEFEDDRLSDYEIIGGFGKNYLMAERAGIELASSDIPLFLADQTVFKGTARYDGMPVAGEAFVVVNYNNTDPTTTKTFPIDYANTALNDLVLVAAAHGSTTGKTVITVSNTIAQSDPALYYKLGEYHFECGDAVPSGFSDLTSGSTGITAAAGKKITVIEKDGNNRIVSAGVVVSVPKTA